MGGGHAQAIASSRGVKGSAATRAGAPFVAFVCTVAVQGIC